MSPRDPKVPRPAARIDYSLLPVAKVTHPVREPKGNAHQQRAELRRTSAPKRSRSPRPRSP
jgi:hypothetical protein